MEALIRELIPHAPNIGLYLSPHIPERMLARALGDYGGNIEPAMVIVLYDATRLGSGGDGALFTDDRLAFQNNDLERGQMVRYSDVVGVRSKRRFLGGRYVEIEINRGRATVSLRLDFSAKSEAATYVSRFLSEAMLLEPRTSDAGGTNWEHVESALERLVREGQLSESDRRRMLEARDT